MDKNFRQIYKFKPILLPNIGSFDFDIFKGEKNRELVDGTIVKFYI